MFTSCVQVEDSGIRNNNKKTEKKVEERIIFKDHNYHKGYGFVIIEVDGKEYLSAYEGGIIELKKD